MAMVGGIQDVENKNDVHIQDLARRRRPQQKIEHSSAIRGGGEGQTASGCWYDVLHITLEVLDGDEKKLYEAKIWEKLWMDFKEVQEFKPLVVDPSAESSA